MPSTKHTLELDKVRITTHNFDNDVVSSWYFVINLKDLGGGEHKIYMNASDKNRGILMDKIRDLVNRTVDLEITPVDWKLGNRFGTKFFLVSIRKVWDNDGG